MLNNRFVSAFILFYIAGANIGSSLHADEGMWLFNAPPIEQLKTRYSFELTPPWLEHLQKCAVRFGNGSGAFVSADGLIITNQHIAAETLQKLSTKENDYVHAGFYARSRADELKCNDLVANILISIENVTERVNGAIKPEMNVDAAASARKAILSSIEKESLEKTGLRSTVISMYQGSEYHLYRYKRYTDIRLVFAPEQQAALFGGDPDNFEFPRYDIDIAFLRAYENGQPAKIDHHLKVAAAGTKEDDLVFATGHPGRSSRSLTVAELKFLRDVHIPRTLAYLDMNETLMTAWSARSEENARRAQDELLTVQNSRKLHYGRYEALLSKNVFTAKRKEEDTLKEFARTHTEFNGVAGAWDAIEGAQKILAAIYTRQYALESYILNSTTIKLARIIERAVSEKPKPSGERLREYRDTNLPTVELTLFADQPLYDDFEQFKLTLYFTHLVEDFGINSPLCETMLGEKTPSARAAELIGKNQIKDVAFRKRLYAMSPKELSQVDDPILALVRAIDVEGRSLRKTLEQQTEVKDQAYAKIAKIRYAKDGGARPPDATSSLRLCFGKIKSYEDRGQHVEAYTTLGGVFTRSTEHKGREPFDLPPSWAAARDKLDASTPFNFVSTCDIVGGNSGSPTINRAGELVGIIFDQNLPSLIGDYAYNDEQSRAISVDIRAIVETLRIIYKADPLLTELLK